MSGSVSRRLRRGFVAAFSSVAVAVTAGCGGSDAVGESFDADSVDLSLLVASAHRAMTIENQAENILIRDCMKEAGFEFYVDLVTPSDFPIEQGFQIYAGVMTSESAPQTGYGPFLDSPYFSSTSSDTDEPIDPAETENAETRNAEYYFALSSLEQAAYEIAFNGGHDGTRITLDDGTEISGEGCVADARKEVLGEQWLDVIVTFNSLQMSLGQLDIQSDTEFAAAAMEWRSCMADYGYEFEGLGDAISAGISLRGESVKPTSEELDQAVADVSCQDSADLAGASQRAYERLQGDVVEENVSTLLAWREFESTILERSSAVLGVTFETAN